jgi:hypothetical protein
VSDDLSGVRPPNFSEWYGYESYPSPLAQRQFPCEYLVIGAELRLLAAALSQTSWTPISGHSHRLAFLP